MLSTIADYWSNACYLTEPTRLWSFLTERQKNNWWSRSVKSFKQDWKQLKTVSRKKEFKRSRSMNIPKQQWFMKKCAVYISLHNWKTKVITSENYLINYEIKFMKTCDLMLSISFLFEYVSKHFVSSQSPQWQLVDMILIVCLSSISLVCSFLPTLIHRMSHRAIK